MKREILFRGKRDDNGEWVQGYYVQQFKPKIFPLDRWENAYEVHPHTVGQFMGMKDKNGNRIFEDDILSDEEYESWEWRGVVKFSHGLFGAEWLTNQKRQDMLGVWGQLHNLRRLDDGILDRKIVIGNIHDNPELLKEEK